MWFGSTWIDLLQLASISHVLADRTYLKVRIYWHPWILTSRPGQFPKVYDLCHTFLHVVQVKNTLKCKNHTCLACDSLMSVCFFTLATCQTCYKINVVQNLMHWAKASGYWPDFFFDLVHWAKASGYWPEFFCTNSLRRILFHTPLHFVPSSASKWV